MTIVRKMTKKRYDTVENEDDYDCRLPLHPVDAFDEGIAFKAKCIGTLDVPRPTTRLEIVSSMRRIRYEFKARGIKKKKVIMNISADGVKVVHKMKRRKRNNIDESKLVLHDHPIYRIFYVSHDSQDMKIFSYIAKDDVSNVFKCSVFKASKTSRAMRIVRTIGQAFDVCRQLYDDDELEAAGEKAHPLIADLPPYDSREAVDTRLRPLALPPGEAADSLDDDTIRSPLADRLGAGGSMPPAGAPLSSHHEWQLLQQQLLQQQDHTQAALAQVQLLGDQLRAEATARLEAQSRTHQLMSHNRQLLAHVRALAAQLQLANDDVELELDLSSSSSGSSASVSASVSCEDVKLAAASDASSIDAELCRVGSALQLLAVGTLADLTDPPQT